MRVTSWLRSNTPYQSPKPRTAQNNKMIGRDGPVHSAVLKIYIETSFKSLFIARIPVTSMMIQDSLSNTLGPIGSPTASTKPHKDVRPGPGLQQ